MDSPAVYLEDVQTAKGSEQEQDEKSTSPSSTPANSQKSTSTASGKRQRTLMDMFAGGTKNSTEPSTKKARVSASESMTSLKIAGNAPSGSSGLQKLNSIPFSLSEYQESLTEEQKDLLRLECEVMGLAW